MGSQTLNLCGDYRYIPHFSERCNFGFHSHRKNLKICLVYIFSLWTQLGILCELNFNSSESNTDIYNSRLHVYFEYECNLHQPISSLNTTSTIIILPSLAPPVSKQPKTEKSTEALHLCSAIYFFENKSSFKFFSYLTLNCYFYKERDETKLVEL